MDKTIFYSDNVMVTHNIDGFILNFKKDKTDIEDEIDYGFRIGLSPSSAKKILYILLTAIGEYEKENGRIKIAANIIKILEEKPLPIGFQPPVEK